MSQRPGPGYTHERITQVFTTRKLSDEEMAKFIALKKDFENMCHKVLDETPTTPHQTIAINKIIEAKDAACLGFITYVPETVESTPAPAPEAAVTPGTVPEK